MKTVLRALLAAAVITFIDFLDNTASPNYLNLIREFIIFFSTLLVIFYVIRKIEEHKKK